MSFLTRAMNLVDNSNHNMGELSKRMGKPVHFLTNMFAKQTSLKVRRVLSDHFEKPIEWCYDYTREELEKMQLFVLRDLARKYYEM